MSNVLIVNLTRFGDLLQSQSLITTLAKDNHRVGLVCLESFLSAAHLLSNLSFVSAFPGSRLTKYMDEEQAGAKNLWILGLQTLATWQKELYEEFSYDVVCSLTPTIASRLLAKLLSKDKVIRGFSVDDYGFELGNTPWANYMQGSSSNRMSSPFNIVDVFRRIGDLKEVSINAVKSPEDQRSSNLLRKDIKLDDYSFLDAIFGEYPEDCKGFIGFQLGASRSDRQWPVDSFARVGQYLWDNKKLCPVLLGVKSEEYLVEEYKSLSNHPFVSAVGKTSALELATILQKLELVLTNDTGTMHLAAGLEVPVVGIFLSTAQPFDTGPYLNKSIALEANLDCHPCSFDRPCHRENLCKFTISSDDVIKVCIGYLEGEDLTSLPLSDSIRAWESYFDSYSNIFLRPLGRCQNMDRYNWFTLLREAFTNYFDNKDFFSLKSFNLCNLSTQSYKNISKELSEIKGLIGLICELSDLVAKTNSEKVKEKLFSNWNLLRANINKCKWLSAFSYVLIHDIQSEQKDYQEFLIKLKRMLHLFDCLNNSIFTSN